MFGHLLFPKSTSIFWGWKGFVCLAIFIQNTITDGFIWFLRFPFRRVVRATRAAAPSHASWNTTPSALLVLAARIVRWVQTLHCFRIYVISLKFPEKRNVKHFYFIPFFYPNGYDLSAAFAQQSLLALHFTLHYFRWSLKEPCVGMLKETVILTSFVTGNPENARLTCTSRMENPVLTVMGNKAFVLTETVLREPNNVR